MMERLKKKVLNRTVIVSVLLGQFILFFKYLWVLKGLCDDHWPGLFWLDIWGTVSSFIIYIWKVGSDRSDVCLIPSKVHLKMHYIMKCLINLCFLNVGLSIVYLRGTVHFCQSITASKSVIEWSTGNNMLINFDINMLLCIFL